MFAAWRPGHWASWMFEVDAHATVNCPNTTETGCTELGWHIGGFQGARGSDKGAEWFIENVMEELDAENEFFFDKETSELYLYYVSSLRLEMYTLFSLFPSILSRLLVIAERDCRHCPAEGSGGRGDGPDGLHPDHGRRTWPWW